MTRNYEFEKTLTNNNAIQLAAQYGKCKKEQILVRPNNTYMLLLI